MLHELRNVRQEPGDYHRRWFVDDNLEIVVWYDPADSITGFQICYDPKGRPRALTWTAKRGFSHAAIDAGEDKPTANRAPLLIPSSDYDAAMLRESFLISGGGLPSREKAFIEGKLAEYRPEN